MIVLKVLSVSEVLIDEQFQILLVGDIQFSGSTTMAGSLRIFSIKASRKESSSSHGKDVSFNSPGNGKVSAVLLLSSTVSMGDKLIPPLGIGSSTRLIVSFQSASVRCLQ